MDKLTFYIGSGLASALLGFIGIGAIYQTLRRFGSNIKVSLWMIFIILWSITSIVGYNFGNAGLKYTTFIALIVLVIGILAWIISLVFRSKIKN